MKTRPSRDTRRALIAAMVAIGLFTIPAWAQEALVADTVNPIPDDESDAALLDKVIVTGSRIRREPGFEGPAPMSLLSAEHIRASGHTQISDVLNQMPGFAVTQTNQTSNLAGNPGINALDLRGMGVQRTLTLVDGRRQVPSIPGTSGVDLSMVPSSLVERVEVITGGASALYGADAVNGVANLILKQDFEGLEASLRRADSSRWDMPATSGDVLFGKNFAGHRGNFTVYGFWEKNSGEVSGQDRPWTANGYPLYMRANANERYRIIDRAANLQNTPDAQVVLGNCTSADWVPCLYSFTPDGRLRRSQLGPGGLINLTPITGNVLGDGLTDGGEFGGRYDSWYLVVPSDRQSTRATLNFTFTEAARLFSSVSYAQSQSKSSGRSLNAFAGGGPESVPVDSPFITEEMIEANGGPFTRPIAFGRHFDEELGRSHTDYKRKLFQGVVGLEGDFTLGARAWNYSGYYSYGRSKMRVRVVDAASTDRFYMGLDSTVDANNNPVCREPVPGCVAVNPFKRLTPEMANWLKYSTDWSDTTMTQKVTSAYMAGGLFDIQGGEVKLAVGGEYRKERNDIGVIAQFDPTSPKFDETLGGISTPLVGEYSVKEAFVELHIPLLADLPFIKRLSLDLAGRVSDYSTAGRTTTNKLGAEWAPLNDLTFRGTYGKAIRAPNIGELYTAGSISGLWITDPCNQINLDRRLDRSQYTAANCVALGAPTEQNYWNWRDIVYSGNLDLQPETAKTATWGFVIRPQFIHNFIMSVDYYRIDLRGVISVLNPQTIINRCVDLSSLDNVFCDAITRDANNELLEVAVRQLNLAQSLARGVDINATWSHDFSAIHGERAGRVSIDLRYGRTLSRIDVDDPEEVGDTGWDYVGLFGTPKWKGTIRTGWNNQTFSAYWTLRHVTKMRGGHLITEENYERVWTGNVFYSDLWVNYKTTRKVEFFAGMNNVFDRAPPRVPGAEAGGSNFNQTGMQAGLFDVLGRTFYAGIRVAL